MDGLFFDVVLFFAGLVLLVKGADWLVDSAVRIAKRFGISEFIIGLTIVAVGTTIPEFGASVTASFAGNSGIAVGNIVGSVVLNLAFILALTALFLRVKITKQVFFDSVLMFGAAVLLYFFCQDGVLSRAEGMLFLLLFFARVFYFIVEEKIRGWEKSVAGFARRYLKGEIQPRAASAETAGRGMAALERFSLRFLLGESVLLAASVLFIFAGANFLVDSAGRFPINPFLAGVILVSVGTSLPEIAVALTCIRKRLPAITVGDIIGANIANILWVGGAAAVASPLAVPASVVSTELVFALLATGLFVLFVRKDLLLGRKRAIALVLLYFVFLAVAFTTKIGAVY